MTDPDTLTIAELPLWQRKILEQTHALAAERARLSGDKPVFLPERSQWQEQLKSYDRFRREHRARARALCVPERWLDAVNQQASSGLVWSETQPLPTINTARTLLLDGLRRQVERLDTMSVVAAEHQHRHSVAAATTSSDGVADLDDEVRQFHSNLGQRWLLATGYADVIGASGAERQQIWDEVTASRPRRAGLARSADESVVEEVWRGFCFPDAYDEARTLYELLVPAPEVDPGAATPAAFPSPHALLAQALTQRRLHHPLPSPSTDAVTAAVGDHVEIDWNDDDPGHTPPATEPTPGLEP
ncbi:hypothetical protein [Nocardia suismassiliense]|uniref:hypothetical protein n=1 Tax=Nocardia suismassiliense TaxID=2077092 RepID=UPI000D1DAEFC|nr:hypothetical protein [Nocardia suismassiliense]